MARIKNNKLWKSLTGKVGELLIKEYKYGTVVTVKPDRSAVKLSAKQKMANKHFSEAVLFAQGVLADCSRHYAYEEEVKNGMSLYHAAVADYMRKVKEESEKPGEKSDVKL